MIYLLDQRTGDSAEETICPDCGEVVSGKHESNCCAAKEDLRPSTDLSEAARRMTREFSFRRGGMDRRN